MYNYAKKGNTPNLPLPFLLHFIIIYVFGDIHIYCTYMVEIYNSKLLLCIFSQLHFQWLHVDHFKSAMMGVTTTE